LRADGIGRVLVNFNLFSSMKPEIEEGGKVLSLLGMDGSKPAKYVLFLFDMV
jgi:hypothetical protein